MTYLLLKAAISGVLVALAARFAFHEAVSPMRWLGIALITAGVGFVAAGPSLTTSPKHGPNPTDVISQEAQS